MSSLHRWLSTWRYLHLLLSSGTCRTTSATRPWLSTDISCPQQQTHRQPLLLLIDGTDRWTNTRPLHRSCSAYYVGSVNNLMIPKTLDVDVRRRNVSTLFHLPVGSARCASQMTTDVRNHAHTDWPWCKWLHLRHGLWCLVPTSNTRSVSLSGYSSQHWQQR